MNETMTATRALMHQWKANEERQVSEMRSLLESVKREAELALLALDEDTVPVVSRLKSYADDLVKARLRYDVLSDARRAMYSAQTHDAKA